MVVRHFTTLDSGFGLVVDFSDWRLDCVLPRLTKRVNSGFCFTENRSYIHGVRLRDMKKKMLLSEFIKGLEMSNHPNVVQLLPLLKENLEKDGDVTIELEMMKKLMEIK